MNKRQENKYAAQLALGSSEELIVEIMGLVQQQLVLPTAEQARKLEICDIVDNRGDGGCYREAMTRINDSMGITTTAPNKLDARVHDRKPLP